jgi:hypothetical protein
LHFKKVLTTPKTEKKSMPIIALETLKRKKETEKKINDMRFSVDNGVTKYPVTI